MSTQYSLQDVKNFYPEINNSLYDILNKYKLLVREYFTFFFENIKIKKQLQGFIFMRGLETITHVFNNILINTKNADMAYYHGQKSYFFYIEFITQITDESHLFLQLSSRDATLFVYKKIIFDVNNTLLKESIFLPHTKNDSHKLCMLENCVVLLKKIFFFLIKNDMPVKFISNITDSICHIFNNEKLTADSYEIIHNFILVLSEMRVFDEPNEKFYQLIEKFLINYTKNVDSLNNKTLKKKIFSFCEITEIEEAEKWTDDLFLM